MGWEEGDNSDENDDLIDVADDEYGDNVTSDNKFLHSDWLRAVQLFFKKCRKQCKKRKQTKLLIGQ